METRTPFCDTARALRRERRMDYMDLAQGCNRVRSHTWWKNLLEHGPWNGPGAVRVSPPDLQAIAGIAVLFQTTEKQVAAMVAADWYGVHHGELSARALRMIPAIEALDEDDAATVERLARRLAEAAAVRARMDAVARGERTMTIYSSRAEAYADLGLESGS